MSFEKDYEIYAAFCERAIEHVKVSIGDYLKELELTGQRSPISSVETRIKTLDSTKKKCEHKKVSCNIKNVQEHVKDVGGIRIIVPFLDDIDTVAQALRTRLRLHTITIKDYIATPKTSGYRSLHLLIQRELYFLDEPRVVSVEVQIRTKAMDLWATIEHTLNYKKNHLAPARVKELKETADSLYSFDERALKLRNSVLATSSDQSQNPPL